MNIEITLTTGEKIKFTNTGSKGIVEHLEEMIITPGGLNLYAVNMDKDFIRIENIIRWRVLDD